MRPDERAEPWPPRELVSCYPMGVVEAMTGLTRRQIRYYESAGLLSPDRTAGGHRLFSDRDVRELLRIRSLRGRGLRTMDAVSRAMSAERDVRPARLGGVETDPAAYFRRPQVMPLWQRPEPAPVAARFGAPKIDTMRRK